MLDNAAVAITTKLNLGSGYPAQVRLMEKDADTFKGVTHQDTNNTTAQAADFGLPTSFVDSSKTYDTYTITVEKTENSPTPVEKHMRTAITCLYIPVHANASTKLATVLGL